MKYSSGPQVPKMPKESSDLVEVRSNAGAARQFCATSGYRAGF
jgi:hypothetical protein